MLKSITVSRQDYNVLAWLRNHGSRGQSLEWFYKVLLNSGYTTIQAGQFINKYTSCGILVKHHGNISIDREHPFDYDPAV